MPVITTKEREAQRRSPDSKYNFIQSVGRAFSILEQFSETERQLGVTTIANRVGLHKSTCFGILHTLQQLGYIQQDEESGLYSLGLKSFQLGQAYIGGLDLREVARRELLRIVEQTHETVHLVVLEGRRAIYIDKVEAPHAMTIASRIGQEALLYCTGVGKVLLAFMPEGDRASVLSQRVIPFTSQTITTPEALNEHLRGIRACGYGFDDQERELGLRCVAAPIFNAKGQAMAAISVSGPTSRITTERMAQLSILMKNAAGEISRQLGYRSGK